MAFLRSIHGLALAGRRHESAAHLDVQAFKSHMGTLEGAPKTIKPAHFVAVELLQVPGRHPIPRNAPVHLARVLRPRRRNARSLHGPRPAGPRRPPASLRWPCEIAPYSGSISTPAARIATGYRLKVSHFHHDGDEATVAVSSQGWAGQNEGYSLRRRRSDRRIHPRRRHRKRAAVPPAPGTAFGSSERSRDDRTHHKPATPGLLPTVAGRCMKWNSLTARRYASASTRRIRCGPPRQPSCSIPKWPFEAVHDLLDHKHITTTQIYDKRRRAVRDSASHKMPI